MNEQQDLRGQGTVQTLPDNREIPVFYTLTIERETGSDDPGDIRMNGRVGVTSDPWLEDVLVEQGRILILEDGRRLEVRIRKAGRGSSTLPFRARPLDPTEFSD